MSIALPRGGYAVLALHRDGAWIVGGPGLLEPAAWPVSLTDDELIAVVTATALACAEGMSVPTPWRWGRTAASWATELADALLEVGVDAPDVGIPVDFSARGGTLVRHPRAVDRVVLDLGGASLEVDRGVAVGWSIILDVEDAPGSRGRMDLRRAITGVRDPHPFVPVDLVSTRDLAELLAEERVEAAPSGKWGRLNRFAPTPRCKGDVVANRRHKRDPHDARQEAQIISEWWRWCGFTDSRVVGTSWDQVRRTSERRVVGRV